MKTKYLYEIKLTTKYFKDEEDNSELLSIDYKAYNSEEEMVSFGVFRLTDTDIENRKLSNLDEYLYATNAYYSKLIRILRVLMMKGYNVSMIRDEIDGESIRPIVVESGEPFLTEDKLDKHAKEYKELMEGKNYIKPAPKTREEAEIAVQKFTEEVIESIHKFKFEVFHYRQIDGNREVLTVSYVVTNRDGIMKDIDTLLVHELNLEHKSLTINEEKKVNNPYYARVVFYINHILSSKVSLVELKEILNGKELRFSISIKGED